METAGLYRRRRRNKIAAIVGFVITLALGTIVALDVTGYYTLPGMGLVYEYSGFRDPNVDRALGRTQKKLTKQDISPKERVRLEKLRAKLIGTQQAKTIRKNKRQGARKGPGFEQGIKTEKKLDKSQRDLAKDIFGDKRKKSGSLKLADPSSIQAPNLPDGLTAEAIYEVIEKNGRSMQLCFSEAMRKGENLAGKMEIELTIAASGAVKKASIRSGKFRASVMGKCTVKRAKGWKFPRFNGEPVTVIYPYILQMSF